MLSGEKTIAKLDAELVKIVSGFLLLGPLSWSKVPMKEFLRNAERGNLKLPKISYEAQDYSDEISTLKAYVKKIGVSDDPAISFLRDSAQSYLDAYMILQGIGTPDVTEFSRKLYGSPQDLLTGYKRRNIDVAKYFLRIVSGYKMTISKHPMIYSSSQFKRALRRLVRKGINQWVDPISIVVDKDIIARAAAGSNYVKIRRGAKFSESDLDQLFHHEVMIHTLTYINGRKQPLLKMLGYNAPRTTATQEGLAVFSEYINSSIDLTRLKRIALRIIAIDMAEKGADFIDLFKFFSKNEQDEEESYLSAMRIFRGGKPEGGIVFYKDNVYLKGLMEVTSFFKKMVHEGRLHEIDLMFCGKLTSSDIFRFQEMSEKSQIIDPAYLPEWAQNKSELAAHLAFSDITERFG